MARYLRRARIRTVRHARTPVPTAGSQARLAPLDLPTWLRRLAGHADAA